MFIDIVQLTLLLMINAVSLIATAYAFRLLFEIRKHKESSAKMIISKTFFLFCVSVMLITVGDLFWTIYEQVMGINPYPSIADVFYSAGYIAMIAGFAYLDFSLLKVEKNIKTPLMRLAVTSILALAVTFWIIDMLVLPSQEWSSSLEATFDIFYPVLSALLITFSSQIYFLFRKNSISTPLLFMMLGAILIYLGDITLSYYTWNDSYCLVAIISDSAYLLSYIMFALAFNKFFRTLQGRRPANSNYIND